MKKASLLSLFLVFVLLLAACGPAETDPQVEPGIGEGTTGTVETPVLPDTGMQATPGAGDTALTPTPALPGPGTDVTPTPGDGAGSTPAAPQTPASPGTPGAGTATAPAAGRDDLSRLSNLIGYPVVTEQGQDLGEIEDLVVDLSAEMVLYAIVSLDNGQTAGSQVAVPLFMLRSSQAALPGAAPGAAAATPTHGQLTFSHPDTALTGAPAWNLAGVDFSDETWNAEIEAYWEGIQSGTDEAEDTEDEAEAEETPAAAPEPTPAPGTLVMTGIVLASNLLGAEVAEDQTQGDEITAGQTLGTVEDALIDPVSGRILYLLLDLEQAPGEWTPVPASRLLVVREVQDTAAEQPTLLIDSQALGGAPTFSAGSMPDTLQPGWDDDIRQFWQSQ